VKSLIAFSQVLLQDLGERCCISTIRDVKTISDRIEHEGESFLTILLPSFGKDFQKSLDQGFVAHTSFAGFRRWRGLPRFLGGFLELVFDRDSGRLLADPSIDAILAVHQITSMFGKMFKVCSDARLEQAMAGFIQCEQDVRLSDSRLSSSLRDEFERVSSVLFREVFTELETRLHREPLLPKHGPGATAEKLSANSKYTSMVWTERLERVFPSGEYLFPNFGWYHTNQEVDILEPGAERPVRVIAVPKTMKAPRIIAIEPVYMQYVQQALLEPMTELIQRDDLLRTTLGNLDQLPNRELAKQGSSDGTLATLDLSEASDRVSNQLVRTMLQRWPLLHEAVDACRSRKADVPGHGVIRLAKFASMGSAMTFAIEGLVFSTIVFMAISRSLNRPVTKGLVREHLGRVRIYGDDIVVPVDTVHHVIELLEAFGLKVNSNKSFWTGKFRESCGGDYYDGHWVTPVRMRADLPSSRGQTGEIVSTISLRNQLFVAGGFDRSVQFLDGILEKVLPHFPEVPVDHPALGRWTYEPVMAGKIHKDTQQPLIRALRLQHEFREDHLSDHGALMKWFLKRGDLPFADRNHLQFAGRPISSSIKYGWSNQF